MTEREACALLKAKFESVGYTIAENVDFDDRGVAFEMDGFDAARRVGYEYVTEEAGDGWDVDGEVIAALMQRREAGELYVLVVDERDAPTLDALAAAADQFLAALPKPTALPKPKKPAAAAKAKKPAAPKKPAAKKRSSRT